jgi:hypothetical protein
LARPKTTLPLFIIHSDRSEQTTAFSDQAFWKISIEHTPLYFHSLNEKNRLSLARYSLAGIWARGVPLWIFFCIISAYYTAIGIFLPLLHSALSNNHNMFLCLKNNKLCCYCRSATHVALCNLRTFAGQGVIVSPA